MKRRTGANILMVFGVVVVVVLLTFAVASFTVAIMDPGDVDWERHEYCKDNAASLSCTDLFGCDADCNDLVYSEQSLRCHSQFTNQILARCVGGQR